MTNDEAMDLLIEQGAKMVAARVRGYDAQVELTRAGADWGEAALELAEALGEDGPEVSADVQYECFLEACLLAGVYHEHPALEEERQTFELMRQAASSELN